MNTKRITKQYGKQITFSQWSRKGFAVFASLNSVVKIGFLSSAISLLANVEKGYSQTDTIQIGNHIDIDEVAVSANRTQKMFSEVSRVMTIIPASEIQSTSAQSLNELLKALPGIDIRQRGGQGVQSDISLRGGSFEQTLILVNGIPVNDPQTGHHNLNIPINLESIERIEVLHGAGARVYGPNAFTGAVNIITNASNAQQIKALISGGQYGLYDANASLQINSGKLNNYISLGAKTSDGYIANTDFKSYNFFYRGIVNAKPGQFSFQAGYLNKAFGAQDFYTLDFPEQYEQVRQTSTALSYKKSIEALTISANVHWKENHDRFELFREDAYQYKNGYYIAGQSDTAKYYSGIFAPWNYYAKHNYHMTRVGGANVNVEYHSVLGRSALGVDYRIENIFSNVLGTAIDTIDAPGEVRGFFSKSASRKYVNAFAEHSYTYKAFDITAGLLFHNNSNYGSGLYGGTEVSYAIKKHFRVFGSVNQAMRIPTFTDLYYSGPSNVGNVNLKPEESVTYEIGFKNSTPAIKWQVAAYKRNTTNAIDWVKYPTETKYTTANFTELNTAGLDVFLKCHPSLLFDGLNAFKYISASYSFADVVTTKQDSSISAYSLDFLRHKATISTDVALIGSFGVRLDLSYNKRNGNYEDVNDNLIDYEDYLLLDARLYYQKKLYAIYLDVNNIFNKQYFDIGGIPQAGIWIKAGVKINLDIKN